MHLETKASYADAEIKSAFDEFLATFEAFKQDNDERLKQIEKRSADVLSDEKVERINQALSDQKRALDELTLAAHRPALGETRPAPDRLTREKQPHWVVVTGFDDRFVYVHDPNVDEEGAETPTDRMQIPIPLKDFARMARYGRSQQKAALVIRHPTARHSGRRH